MVRETTSAPTERSATAGSLAASFCSRLLDGRPPDRVLFIAGTSYCGSTLLSFLLNAHPKMVSIGEETGPHIPADKLSTFPCSCGALLAECPFWLRVGERMAGLGFDFAHDRWATRFRLGGGRLRWQLLCRSLRSNLLDDLRDALVSRVPAWRRQLDETAARTAALTRVVLDLTDSDVFAAAGKDPTRVRYLERIGSLDVRVLHLVRDAPGFVASNIKNNNSTLDASIRTWKRVAGHTLRLFRTLPPERTLRMRYEDLCRDVEGSLATIARFAGVEPVSGPVSFRESEHHIIGNRMRLATSDEVILDEKWKSRLTAGQLAEIERRTRSLRQLFGYT